MRDLSSWYDALPTSLAAEGFPGDVMPATEFCRVELGLYFLTRFFPGEPVGALQPVLSGYVRSPDDLTLIIRRVRHRLGDVSRRGYWRRLVSQYLRVPDAVRAYDRTGPGTHPVNDQTVFTERPTSVCPERLALYESALNDRLVYRTPEPSCPAPVPGWYRFPRGPDAEYVHLDRALPVVPPIANMQAQDSRQRQPWRVSFPDDLEPIARWIDEQLAGRPDITDRDWAQRLRDLQFNGLDASGALVLNPQEFVVDGVEHLVGLMNSGKTTLTDLITVEGALRRHRRICLVLGSVGDVYTKVSFLRALGIEAVPLIGRGSRGEHAGRYWSTVVNESSSLIPAEEHLADPAAAYANTTCLLERFRQSPDREWKPLHPDNFPCHRGLTDVSADPPRSYDCPFLPVCPAQRAHREVATASVWVTTPQCLLRSWATPSTASMRWLEQVQHDMDLMIIDEADSVQQVLDSSFVQTEQLVSKDKGWTGRMVAVTNEALTTEDMAPSVHLDVQRWHELLQIHQQAVFSFNRLALDEKAAALRKHLGNMTFTAHALFRLVARLLHGLPADGEGPSSVEDEAESFYQRHLQRSAEEPLDSEGSSLEAVVTEIVRPRPDSEAVRTALELWIDQQEMRLVEDRHRPFIALTIEAAVWASRITTTFFEMGTLYPAVRERLRLPDEVTFFLSQPPRDYRHLVPEAPMGNILALRWAPAPHGGASLQLLWVHGIGRWLLHHAHDLLSCEGVEGPNVILTSATSWIPGSSFYHVPITPSAVLGQRDSDRQALMRSTLSVRPARVEGTGDPIFVSGRSGTARQDALRQMVTALCEPVGGKSRSLVEGLRDRLPVGRKQILFVVLSGAEAEDVSDTINNRRLYRARHVVPDASDPGTDGIRRRLVGGFGTGDDDILVAAELSIQRGYNILNAERTAALGAVIYLARSHPPPFDLAFPLSLISQYAMKHLLAPTETIQGLTFAVARELRQEAHSLWFGSLGRPTRFGNLREDLRTAFVANNLVPMSQTVGRSIRGNQPTEVLLCDAAFAERLARRDPAPDTGRTSLVVATDALLGSLLAPPPPGTDPAGRRIHTINTAVWSLMGHLVRTNDPLGTERS